MYVDKGGTLTSVEPPFFMVVQYWHIYRALSMGQVTNDDPFMVQETSMSSVQRESHWRRETRLTLDPDEKS